MRETYKYYAGMGAGRVASTSSGQITEILKNCNNFIDGRVIKLSDVDLEVLACNGGKKGGPNWLSPDKSLVRF
jgi:hypothetical protein